jgi:hypothetical protein
MTREEWLNRAAERLLDIIADKTELERPEAVQVSVGFPRQDRNGQVVGQCWTAKSGKGVIQVFVSPLLDKPVAVLGVLLHELIHAADDCQHQHKGAFARAMKQVGFTCKPTLATVPSTGTFRDMLTAIWLDLGDYPHQAMTPGQGMYKKQGTRMIKCECEVCGYTVRTTQKWLDIATPNCPACSESDWDQPLTIEQKESGE